MHASRSVLVRTALGVSFAIAAAGALAAPVVYEIDPTHTYPSFEADHMGGLSTWRGKFNTTHGTITLDRAAESGTLAVSVDIASIDFGLDEMNAHAKKADLFDLAQYPHATYAGKLEGFRDGAPTRVVGELTLRGVTRPVVLAITSFKCVPHPMHKREVCGADAKATFQRDEFGMSAGKDYGFNMDVTLRIQVEALQAKE